MRLPNLLATRGGHLAARGTILAVLGSALILLAGYGSALNHPFQFDDFSSIRDNAVLDHPARLKPIWSFRPSRFVVHESLALNIALTGRSPAGLRAINLLIHLGTALLAGALAGRLAGRSQAAAEIGLWTALLFAAHPLATQAVTYVIQRTASLAALLELGAVVLFLRARDRGGIAAWVGSWFLALMAALTKEMAIVLPGLILLAEWAARKNEDIRPPHRGRLLPYFAVVPLIAFTATLRSAELDRAVTGLTETADIGRLTYLLTEMTVIPRYLRLFVWPQGQNLDPDIPLQHAPGPAVLLGAALIAAVTVAAILVRRRHPMVLFGWTWCLVALLPESSLFPIRDVMVEHRMYLPIIGLCIAASALLVCLPGRARWIAPLVLVLVLTGVTAARNRAWRSHEALWSDVVSKSPHKARGHNNLAMALDAEGRAGEAEAEYREAIRLEPDYLYARINLGRLLGMERRFRESIAVLEDACRIDPDNVPALNNLGLGYEAVGDTAAAVQAFLRAVRADPGARTPRENLERLMGKGR